MNQILFLNEPWTREDVEKDPEWMYLFTDNLLRTSGNNPCISPNHYVMDYCFSQGIMRPCYPNSSQACIRGLGNAWPITTMKDFRKTQLSDDDLEMMKEIWIYEFKQIYQNLPFYRGLKCSSRQFGWGTYSRMKKVAPKCFEFLSWCLWDCLGIDNREETLRYAI